MTTENERYLENLRSDLVRFLFKEGLAPDEVQSLCALAEYSELEPGDMVLREGQSNTKLFFLIEGTIQVLREGEILTRLRDTGDLLGEMSVITGSVCSATLVAETRTSLLAMDTAKIGLLSERLQGHFSNSLSRLFNVILARKLAATNEKARLFESTNRDLQRARRALETASADKIGEMTRDQGRLRARLTRILVGDPASFRPELEAVMSTLGPDISLKNKTVLLAENDVTQQINARMSLGGTGVDLTVVDTLESAEAALRTGRFDVVCVSEPFVGLVPLSKSIHPKSKYVFVTSEQISKHIKTLRDRPELSAIIARHPEDRLFTVKNTATTVRKLITGDMFGIEKYLSWGTELKEFPVRSSSDRPELIEKMSKYLTALGIGPALLNRSSSVAEELLMNAIYDAPTDPHGKPLYNHLPRTVPIALSESEQATFRYGCDGAFIAVSVEDPFGTLERSVIVDYLERCFFRPEEPTPEGKGGGGLGLFQLIQLSNLVVFNVRPHSRTEVIALFNINVQTDRVRTNSSFHYFEAA